MQPGKPPKPPRQTFPAAGESVRLEFQREGNNVRYQVLDGKSGEPRYLGQAQFQQAMDVAAVKLFVSNRNGVEPVDVILRDLTIRADRDQRPGDRRPHRLRPGRLRRPDLDRERTSSSSAASPRRPPGAAERPAGHAARPAPQPGTPAPARRPVPLRRPPPRLSRWSPSPRRRGEPWSSRPPPATAVRVRRAAGGRSGHDAEWPRMPPGAPGRGSPGPKPPTAEAQGKIPLDEVESIHFERSPGMTARFVGQPNLDFTMPGLSYKPEEAKKDDLPDDVFAPDPKDPKYLADQKAETKKEEPKKAVAKKAEEEEKKAEEEDDVNAPPPGTTAPTKIAKARARRRTASATCT